MTPHFKSAPASRNHHHNYPGGLVVHTYEVFQIAKSMIDSLPALNSPYEFSPYGLETDIEDRNTILRILFIASLYHDYCKVFEYDEFGNKTNWADQVGHVVGGYELFCEDMKDVISTELSGTERNEISHILLSHHGRKEWGSPVEPQTALAQMFHYADMLSSHYGKGK
jgi:3'-5' exoribonuclease